MNTTLLKKVAAEIAAEPRRLKMEDWIQQGPHMPAPCNTAACIAGHAVIIDRMGKDKTLTFAQAAVEALQEDVEENAKDLLELDWSGSEQLFYVDNWPTEFKQRYADADGYKAAAKVAVDRINHFIETDGAE